MMRLVPCAVLAALLVSFATGAPVASAEPPPTFEMAKAVPADTFLLMSVPDVQAVEKGFSRTALARIYRDEEVQEFIAPLLDVARGGLSRLRQEQGIDLFDLLSCLRGEVSLALVDMDLSAGVPYPLALVSVDARHNRDKLESYLDEFLGRALKQEDAPTLTSREFRGVKIRVAQVGRHTMNDAFLGTTYVYATKPELLDAAILAWSEGSRPSLAGSEGYKAAMARVAGDGTELARVFINARSLQDKFAAFLKPYERWLGETGVAGIDALVLSSRMEGAGFTDRIHVHAPGEKRGLFKLVSRKPLDREILRVVPSNAFHVSAGTMDLTAVWDEIMRVLASVQPDVFLDVSARVEEIEEFLKFALKDDLLEAIGDDMLLYVAPPRGGYGLVPEVVLSVDLASPEKFEACLEKTMEAFAEPMKAMQIQRDGLESMGTKIHFFRLPGGIPITPSYAVVKGRLVVGLMPQTIRSFVRSVNAEKKAPSILDRDDVRQALAGMPESATSIGFTDLASVYNLAYNTALPFLQNLDLDFEDIGLDPALLPSAEAVSRHLEPMISYGLADDSGVTWRVHTPVSVLTLMGPAAASVLLFSGVAEPDVAEMEPGVVIPVEPDAEPTPVAPPAEPGPRVDRDLVNLKDIGTAIVVYYVENGAYPETLEKLVEARLLEPGQLISPRDENPQALGSIKSSYDYVGPGIGKLTPEQRKDAVLVWSRQPTRAVLFLDTARPRRTPERKFQQYLEATKARIAAAKSGK